ncbi:MAG: hypothetical protein ACK415_09690 [Thermodesulfovibrionales bacterium]
MDELERLKVLIEHWTEHNREHAQTYKEWAEKAEAMGRKDIATVLNSLSHEAGRLENLFIEALSLVKVKGQQTG